MKRCHRHFVPFQCRIGRMLLLLTFISCQALAQPSSIKTAGATDTGKAAPEMPVVELSVHLDGDHTAEIFLEFESSMERQFNFPHLLSAALDCQLRAMELTHDTERNTTILTADCDIPVRLSNFRQTGSIDLSPILTILNFEPKRDLVLNISVPNHDFVRCDPAPMWFHQSAGAANCSYILKRTDRVSETIHFQSGYRFRHVALMAGILGFLILLPVGASFWFRRRSRLSSEETRPAIWFAYRRFLTWTALFGALLWWAAVDLLRADEFVKFVLPAPEWSDAFASVTIPWVLLWFPPAFSYLVCLALSAPMQSMRGTNYTQKQLLNRSFWAVARFVFPLPLIALGIMELFNSPRVGVLLLVAGFIVGKFTTKRFIRAYGLELYGLSSGVLRDRAFALAEKAGTKLNQLFVLPTESMRMANAFAHAAQNIYLTDYLLKNLDKAEVDAVVAHEIAHLQKKHIGWRSAVTFLLIGGYVFSTTLLERWIPHAFPTGPIFYGLFLLVFFFLSRRNEFAADAGSATLTGNAEAMITALARLTRLNTMPLQWGKLDEKMLTHPSTMRRIRRLASEAGINEARISELLVGSFAPPVDTYPIPPTALPAGKIFSTRYKAQLAGKFAWRIMLTTVVLPACVALAAHWAQLEGGKLFLAYSLGLFVTLAADFALLNFLPMRGLKKIEKLLQVKIRSENTSLTDSYSLFVGLAPDTGPRVYEGNWAWDLGFLTLTSEFLSYEGEETRFSLGRGDISSIYLGPGPTGWFTTPAVYIAWRDSAGREATFNLRPLRAGSMVEMAVKTRQLADDLQNWRALRLPAGPAERNMGVPEFGHVTSSSPRALVRGQYLVRDFFLNTFLAIGTIVVFGLGFPLVEDLSRSSNSASPNPSYGGLYVLLVVWIARVFALLPYWRARDNSVSRETTSTAAQTSR
ncbi:MAG TPA: M48 family metalloprotease [Candidatus Acidoferrum sp.]|jgi:Zn-dependent protease with chaperone function|nr:M48 family metalloprotease [Candidatus Acidoferrum sp.]